MTSEQPKARQGRKRHKKTALQDVTGQMPSQGQPAKHVNFSSTRSRQENTTADNLVGEPKQVKAVSGMDRVPRQKRQMSHWRKKACNHKATDLKTPESNELSVPAVSSKAVSTVTAGGAKKSELKSTIPSRFQGSSNIHIRSTISLPPQATCGKDGSACQQQVPYLLNQESSDTAIIPVVLPSFRPVSGYLNLSGPKFIHGDGVVTFHSINLQTEIACTIDPTGVVLFATLPLIRTDPAKNNELQPAPTTSHSTISFSLSTGTVTNVKAKQASTSAQGTIRRATVSKSGPDIPKHHRDLSNMPGLFKQSEEKDIIRSGGLDTEMNRREFLNKVKPGVDALRIKYGRPAADVSSATDQAKNTSRNTDPMFNMSSGNTMGSTEEHSTTEPKGSGTVVDVNASGSTIKASLPVNVSGKAPKTPTEVEPGTKYQNELSLVPLESMEVKPALKVEPALKLKPTPLAENASSRNKTIKEQARSGKSIYVPPHLRPNMDGGVVKSISSTYEQPNGSNERVTASDSRDTIAPSNAGNLQAQSTIPPGTLPLKTLHPETLGPETLGQNQEMSSVKIDKITVATIKERDPDEIFVPSTKPRTPKVLPLPSVEHLLPPHLRNLPRPRLTGPQVKQNAERAAKFDPLDDETITKQVLSRNEASYKPIVELKATSKLVQELAPDEEVGNTIVAEDNSTSLYSEHSHKNSVDSAILQARQEKRWRWFNQGLQASDPNGYAEAGEKGLKHELADWDGNWGSAPMEWDVRPQFNGYSQAHLVHMEAWIADRVHEALNMPFKVDTEDLEWRSGVLPASGTRKQWQVYPPDCYTDVVPLEYGPVEHPPELPPNDPYSHVAERREQCSAMSQKKFVKEYKASKRQRQDEKYIMRVQHEEMKIAAARRREREGPKANIYIRPAEVRDIPQITTIYNHYVKNTVHAMELTETGNAEWQDRFNRAENETLAFLVAVSKGSRRDSKAKPDGRREETRIRGAFGGRGNFGRRRANVNENRATYQENIFGFVYAEDNAGKQTMFGHVAELQVFVDPKHQRLGIGKTLVDRIMASLDKAYASQDYTDFVPDDRMIYDVGGSREIHKILINIGFHIGDEKEFEWRKKWLEDVWDFDHAGTISCMGKKFGKGVNMAQMVKETNQIHGMSTWYEEQPFRIPHRERIIREREAARLAGTEQRQLQW